jgi:hypothetical protein
MVEGLGVYINSSSARCMDGSSPIYWITKGQGSGVNKWLISFEEGGFCNLIDGGYDNCYYFAFRRKVVIQAPRVDILGLQMLQKYQRSLISIIFMRTIIVVIVLLIH